MLDLKNSIYKEVVKGNLLFRLSFLIISPLQLQLHLIFRKYYYY